MREMGKRCGSGRSPTWKGTVDVRQDAGILESLGTVLGGTREQRRATREFSAGFYASRAHQHGVLCRPETLGAEERDLGVRWTAAVKFSTTQQNERKSLRTRGVFLSRHSPSDWKPLVILRRLRHEWNSCPSQNHLMDFSKLALRALLRTSNQTITERVFHFTFSGKE
jgi:hypothetical protein